MAPTLRSIVQLIWEGFIKPLALYAILWAGFHYWLDFGNKQSIAFAVLFGTCYLGYKELYKRTEKAEDFIPYRVTIRIHNQHDLFFKYRLVKSEEEWNQLGEKVKDTSILRRGLNFTVLSLSKDGLPHLIWWDDHKIFLAGLPLRKQFKAWNFLANSHHVCGSGRLAYTSASSMEKVAATPLRLT